MAKKESMWKYIKIGGLLAVFSMVKSLVMTPISGGVFNESAILSNPTFSMGAFVVLIPVLLYVNGYVAEKIVDYIK